MNFETPDSNTFVVSRTAPKYLVHCTICGSGNITLRLTSSLERGKFEKYGIGKDWKALERSKNVASERWRKDFRAHFLPVLQSLDKCGLWKLKKTFYNSVENCSKLSKALELKMYAVYKGGQSLKHKIDRSIDISPNKYLIL